VGLGTGTALVPKTAPAAAVAILGRVSTTTILAISTPVVSIAGFVFSYLSSSRHRRAARDLAGDSYAHEIDVRRRVPRSCARAP
jgi:hypothetical protein